MAYIKGFGAYDSASNEPFFPFSPNAPAKSGGCGCGGTCGGCGDHDHGMGLFDSMDPSTWGVGEATIVAVGGYLAIKLAGDAMKVGKAVKRKGSRAKKGTAKAASGVTSGIGKAVLLAGAAYGAYYLWSKSQAATGVSGFGDYMAQSFTRPQILASPIQSAAISIPAGW